MAQLNHIASRAGLAALGSLVMAASIATAQPTPPPSSAQPPQQQTPPYRQTPPQPPPAQQAPAPLTAPPTTNQPQEPASDPDRDMALMLLARVQSIVDVALGEKARDPQQPVGTSGASKLGESGVVKVDRASLDEIKALAQQLQTMIRRRGGQ